MPQYVSTRSRERILSYGFAGSGKSQTAIDIARNTTGKLWIVDTDRAWERMMEDAEIEGKVASLVDVRMEAFEGDLSRWAVLTAAIKEAARGMDRDDWLIVDMMSVVWPWAQDYFSTLVYGKAVEEFMLEARQRAVVADSTTTSKSSKSPFEGMTDWPTINRTWEQQLIDVILLAKGHVLMTAEQDDVKVNAGPMSTSDEVMAMFAKIGKIPKGQKGVPYTAHTVIHHSATMAGKFVYTTAKDRIGREYQTMRDLTPGFTKEYLVRVAGWKNEAAVAAAAKAKEAASAGSTD